MEARIWIILASVLGFLVLVFTLTLALFCWKRPARKIRGFSIRSVTPLDDAEFESWRRPSQYTTRPEKYGIRPTQPPVARVKTPVLWEKEIGVDDPPSTPPGNHMRSQKTPSPIRVPQRVRRKSSLSIADRPPTPHSSSSTTGEFVRRESRTSHGSPRTPRHIYYPSMSDASEINFNFDFGATGQSPPRDRASSQSTRRLYNPIDQFSEK
jgi:hypothetical protein